MAGVMPVNAFGEQSLATALAPARQSGPATLGSHPRTETMLAFARSFRWLIGAFHNGELAGTPIWERLH